MQVFAALDSKNKLQSVTKVVVTNSTHHKERIIVITNNTDQNMKNDQNSFHNTNVNEERLDTTGALKAVVQINIRDFLFSLRLLYLTSYRDHL